MGCPNLGRASPAPTLPDSIKLSEKLTLSAPSPAELERGRKRDLGGEVNPADFSLFLLICFCMMEMPVVNVGQMGMIMHERLVGVDMRMDQIALDD